MDILRSHKHNKILCIALVAALFISATGCEYRKTTYQSAENETDENGLPSVIDISYLEPKLKYVMVQDMANNPDKYRGKIIRAKGVFVYTEEFHHKYYTVFFTDNDTAGMFNEGMDFECSEETEYPEIGTEIYVMGEYDCYTEDNKTYCVLKNAKIEIAEEAEKNK